MEYSFKLRVALFILKHDENHINKSSYIPENKLNLLNKF